mmetsp:Transcript_38565/g.69006  ORF Transcript_38565/g.69006 Transcript_38565/m.69006 type:complete len:170 (+) Transcript_38565:2-511(+)
MSQTYDALSKEQQSICETYETDFKQGEKDGRQVFINYCVELVKSVPNHGLDIMPLKGADATTADAMQVVREASKVNDQRKQAWEKWQQAVDCWKDVPEAFESRRDLAEAMTSKKASEARTKELKRKAEEVKAKIAACQPDSKGCQERLDQIRDELKQAVDEYMSVGADA